MVRKVFWVKSFTNYVKYGIILLSTRMIRELERRNAMNNQAWFQEKLNKVLLEQEKESKKVRVDPESQIGTKWSCILPKNYSKIMGDLSQEGLFKEFVCLLRSSAEIEIWNHISNSNLAKILEENYPDNYAQIISEISPEKMERFINSGHGDYEMLFSIEDSRTKIEMLNMLSVKTLEILVRENCKVVCELLEIMCEEKSEAIFKKIAKIGVSETIRLIENATPLVIHNILKEKEKQEIIEICQKMEIGQLLELLRVLKAYNYPIEEFLTDFLVRNLSEEQRQNFFSFVLRQDLNVRQIFSIQTIVDDIYPVVSLVDKEYLLYDVLTKIELLPLYESLSESKRIEMILIMLGKKTTGQYETARVKLMSESVVFVLEEKGNLDYVEKAILNQVKADLEGRKTV